MHENFIYLLSREEIYTVLYCLKCLTRKLLKFYFLYAMIWDVIVTNYSKLITNLYHST